MTLTEILKQAGIVPLGPDAAQSSGTPERKAQSHVPIVPVVPKPKEKGADERARQCAAQRATSSSARRLPAGAIDSPVKESHCLRTWSDHDLRQCGIPKERVMQLRSFCLQFWRSRTPAAAYREAYRTDEPLDPMDAIIGNRLVPVREAWQEHLRKKAFVSRLVVRLDPAEAYRDVYHPGKDVDARHEREASRLLASDSLVQWLICDLIESVS